MDFMILKNRKNWRKLFEIFMFEIFIIHKPTLGLILKN